MILQRLAQRVADRATAEGGYAISPELIMELILQLIECFRSRSEFLAAARAPTDGQRAAMNVVVRSTLGIRRRRNVLSVRTAVLSCASECDEQELVACHAEAAGILNYDMEPESDADPDV